MVISNINSSETMKNMQMLRMSAARKIISVADDPVGISSSEKLLSQSTGDSIANKNGQDAQSVSNVADGGLNGIENSLHKIRELSLKSTNQIYSAEDKASIQEEINRIKNSITDQVKGTVFNTIKIIDNTSDMNLAINPSGTGMSMKMIDTSLETLGIADFDVTKNFSLDNIDKAISKVSNERTDFVVTNNRLDSVIRSNDITNHNVIASMGKITNTDYGIATKDYSTQNALNQTYMAMQSNIIQQYALSAQV